MGQRRSTRGLARIHGTTLLGTRRLVVARPRAPAAMPAAPPAAGHSGDHGGQERGAGVAALAGDGDDALGWDGEGLQQRQRARLGSLAAAAMVAPLWCGPSASESLGERKRERANARALGRLYLGA